MSSLHSPHLASLRDVFRALAQEAEELALLGAGLEQTISAVTYAAEGGEALQNVDRLLQYAGALREFCMSLSESRLASAMIDIAPSVRNIRLDEVANRISCALPGVRRAALLAAAGDCDLF